MKDHQVFTQGLFVLSLQVFLGTELSVPTAVKARSHNLDRTQVSRDTLGNTQSHMRQPGRKIYKKINSSHQ
jgi:hypothetical protein